jgi:hypothetical protein
MIQPLPRKNSKQTDEPTIQFISNEKLNMSRNTLAVIPTTDSPSKKVNPNFRKISNILINEIDNNMNRLSMVKITPTEVKGGTAIDSNAKTILDNEPSLVNDKENIPTFCKSFFIAGLPKTAAKMLPDSETKIAPCRHVDCSILSAYKPDILQRYPTKDTNTLELNSLVYIIFN